LWAEEFERQRQRAEEERRLRIEEDRKIAAQILERKQREEEERLKQKKEIEEQKCKELEIAKKQSLAEKKKILLSRTDAKIAPMATEKPLKRKIISNPFAQKFEEIAQNAQTKEKIAEEQQRQRMKRMEKPKMFLKKSKQSLLRMSKENLKRSRDFLKMLSRQSLEKLSSKEQALVKKSINNLVDNTSSSTTSSMKHMQTYLISQVLFDGQEDITTSKVKINSQATCKGNHMHSEQDRLQNEHELKKKIKQELASIKAAEKEQQLKNEEAKFEEYKKEMEKYLDFVCEKEPHTSVKKVKVKTEPKKLKININAIKNQFEGGTFEDSKLDFQVHSAPVKINKIDHSKLFPVETLQSEISQKQTKVSPVIIDKDAFQRTMELFEKEKKEEEERKRNEEIRRKRKEEMESEKHRLIAEKKRIEEIRKEVEALNEENKAFCNDEKNSNETEDFFMESSQDMSSCINEDPIGTNFNTDCCGYGKDNIDIREQIRIELEKIKLEEEKQQEKIRKERRKKELLTQIQEEITKIQESAVQSKHNDGSSKFLKMVNHSKENQTEIKNKDRHVNRKIFQEEDNNDFDIEPPKWITIFQEKSKKLEDLKSSINSVNSTFRKETVVEENQSKKVLNKSSDRNDCCQAIREKDHFHADKSPKKSMGVNQKQDIPSESSIRKVKTLLFSKDKSVQEDKIETIKVKKDKASLIKKLFESKPVHSIPEKMCKQPKRKIVHVPLQDSNINVTKASSQKWKWKEKDSKELYEFINSNKKYVPERILTKANVGLQNFDSFMQSEEEILHEEAFYDDYLEKIENYIKEETTNDTENIFKETLIAYLDLIDDRPKTDNSVRVLDKKSLTISNTAILRDQFELASKMPVSKPQNDSVITGMKILAIFLEI
jgi:hypothetical protein